MMTTEIKVGHGSYYFVSTLIYFFNFNILNMLVSRLKYVEALTLKFVAPMPEQIATTTMQLFKVPGNPLR